MKSVPTIAFDYRPSPVVTSLSMLLAGAAVIAPWLSGLAVPLRFALCLFALVFAVHAIRAQQRSRFVRIVYRASGWCLVDRAAREWPALLLTHRRLHNVVALDWRYAPRARFQALLTPDNLDADTRRRLVLLLARGDSNPRDPLGSPLL
jgi:hypothetical protein